MIPDLKNQRFIITGCCGTVGYALSKRCAQAGATVIGFDRTGSKEAFLANVKEAKLFIGDLLDLSYVTQSFKEASDSGRVTAVFHLAGQSDANKCEADHALAFQKNTMATVNVLEASMRNNINHLLFPSTGYVYGTNYQGKIKESFETHPASIYPLTKLAAETVIKGYANMGKIRADILRISNIYGPSSNPNTIIGTLLAQSRNSDKIQLQNLTPIRDFIFIDDVIEAMMLLALLTPSSYRVLNLSTAVGISVGELANMFCEVKGLSKDAITSPLSPAKPVSSLVLDNQEITQLLSWHPKVSIRDGLTRI